MNTDGIKKSRGIFAWVRNNNTYLIFVVMVIACCLLSSNFYSWQNISNLLKQNTIIGIVAIGMLLVILTGDIDLSVGSIVGATNVLISVIMSKTSMSIEIAILIAILVGIGFGAANGYFIVFRKLPAFIVTLAIMTIARGFAYIWSEGRPINVTDPLVKTLNVATPLGLPAIVWFLIVTFVIFLVILRYTSYGRIIKAIGSNPEAVRLAGLRINNYRFSVYVIVGLLCAIAGFLGCVRTGVGTPLFGSGYELDAISMAVIGGASLSGGKGDVVKTIIGIFIIGMISNIMNLTNVSAYLQVVIQGLIILGAILLQQSTTKKAA